MSNIHTSVIIRHRTTYEPLQIEEDYLIICEGNPCKALLLKVIEDEMKKATIESMKSDVFFPISYAYFQQAIDGLYRKSSIIAALKELEKDGLIERRAYEGSYDYAYEYRINVPIVQQQVDALPEKKRPQTYWRNKTILTERIVSIISLRTQYALLEKFGGLCAYCQINQAMVWDHIIPIIKGGETCLNNLVPACVNCNSAKRERDVLVWMHSQSLQPCQALLNVFIALGMEVKER